jgi:hypothetical protein
MPSLVPCERDDSPELAELRNLFEEYEILFEECMTGPLTSEDQKTLDEIYGELLQQEYQRWEGVSDEMVANIIGWTDLDFPMLRFELGILPSEEL